ncbi:hypothetical protein XELAEV_18023018mg [Xenopus laevis]|uniref:Uncharacterized protein n=1 Tax=Xenopus laevis TaxID=8355 RepID=A0A974HNQ1_XENLA|nr:hypothetical protein XELAEV_18023018mg [Xenopus laevis]
MISETGGNNLCFKFSFSVPLAGKHTAPVPRGTIALGRGHVPGSQLSQSRCPQSRVRTQCQGVSGTALMAGNPRQIAIPTTKARNGHRQ